MAVAVMTMTFQDWLKAEIDQRRMTYRGFANFLNVAPSTISRLLDEKNPQSPGIDVLLILAEKTHTRLGALVEMAYPDVADATQITPSAALLAQRIESLPQDLRQAIEALIQRGE